MMGDPHVLKMTDFLNNVFFHILIIFYVESIDGIAFTSFLMLDFSS